MPSAVFGSDKNNPAQVCQTSAEKQMKTEDTITDSLLSWYEHCSVKEQVISIMSVFEPVTRLSQDLDRHEKHEKLLFAITSFKKSI